MNGVLTIIRQENSEIYGCIRSFKGEGISGLWWNGVAMELIEWGKVVDRGQERIESWV